MNPHTSAAAPAGKRAASFRSRKRLLLAACAAAFIAVIGMPAIQKLLPADRSNDAPPVTSLHTVVAANMKLLESESEALGIRILITDGFRSEREQDALYRKGRSDPGSIVTNAKGGESFHNYGLAIDFALRTKDGDVIWDMDYDGNGNGRADWMEVVSIAKRLGFTWGGDWASFPDYPHLQMDFGLSIRELQRGHRPPEDIRLAEEAERTASEKA